ncbi:hypothetical protein CKY02_13005 [Photorhabdus bodei]|uniref:Uncharacterized protein n=1 Tax=Photorhabdus bodei TaxID=2029681 RepID=A0A329X871_9GAMM|nr:hypothetical protein CKY02_13005 [Photorhabdus bodei]
MPVGDVQMFTILFSGQVTATSVDNMLLFLFGHVLDTVHDVRLQIKKGSCSMHEPDGWDKVRPPGIYLISESAGCFFIQIF